MLFPWAHAINHKLKNMPLSGMALTESECSNVTIWTTPGFIPMCCSGVCETLTVTFSAPADTSFDITYSAITEQWTGSGTVCGVTVNATFYCFNDPWWILEISANRAYSPHLRIQNGCDPFTWTSSRTYDIGTCADITISIAESDTCTSFNTISNCCGFDEIAATWQTTNPNVSDDFCSNCEFWNAQHELAYLGSCNWGVNINAGSECSGNFWTVTLDCTTPGFMTLDFFESFNFITVARYNLAIGSFDPLGSNVMNFVSNDVYCTNWPATVTITPI